jgi:large subunit ribosomal protein L32
MAVPKKRNTKSKRDRRRSSLHFSAPKLVVCPQCGKLKLPHAVCPYCGYYKGREVIDVLKELGKKEKKQRAKEIQASSKEEELNPEKLSR